MPPPPWGPLPLLGQCWVTGASWPQALGLRLTAKGGSPLSAQSHFGGVPTAKYPTLPALRLAASLDAAPAQVKRKTLWLCPKSVHWTPDFPPDLLVITEGRESPPSPPFQLPLGFISRGFQGLAQRSPQRVTLCISHRQKFSSSHPPSLLPLPTPLALCSVGSREFPTFSR